MKYLIPLIRFFPSLAFAVNDAVISVKKQMMSKLLPGITLAIFNIALLFNIPAAHAIEFTYTQLTGAEYTGKMLYNTAQSNDIAIYAVDTGSNLLAVQNIGLQQTYELSNGAFIYQTTLSVDDDSVYFARDNLPGSQQPEIVKYDLTNLIPQVIIPAHNYDKFKYLVAAPNGTIAFVRDLKDSPSLMAVEGTNIEIFDTSSGATDIVYSITKSDFISDGFIRNIAYDGTRLIWVECPDAYCQTSELWLYEIATQQTQLLRSSVAEFNFTQLVLNNNFLAYTTRKNTGFMESTLSVMDVESGTAWDLTNNNSLIYGLSADGDYIVWAAYEVDPECEAGCFSTQNIFIYDMIVGKITKVTDNLGSRAFFPALQGDRILYVDNSSGYEALMLAEFNARLPYIDPATKLELDALCAGNGTNLYSQAFTRSSNWKDIFSTTIDSEQTCGLTALCISSLADAPMTTQALIKIDNVNVADGAFFNTATENVSLPLQLNNDVLHNMYVELGGLPGSGFQLSINTTQCNTPPIAFAGDDQVITLLGAVVQLDGSQSYDPDGDDITYTWSLTTPDNSNALLSDINSPLPTFIPDVYGEYTATLVVHDEYHNSEVSSVIISFNNLVPVANAGGNLAVTVGETVLLNASGSHDANGDVLTYQWSLDSSPDGSSSDIVYNAELPQASLYVDIAGTYAVSLIVNDGISNSEPDNITIVATGEEQTVIAIAETIQIINELPENEFKNNNLQNALTNKLNAALVLFDSGNYEEALSKLRNDILRKTNGCADTGEPDKNDWINNCESQAQIYPMIQEIITLIETIIGS